MQFVEENYGHSYPIEAYDEIRIQVGGQLFSQSLILPLGQLPQPWGVTNISDLNENSLSVLLAYQPELILIGSGKNQAFPPPSFYRTLPRGLGLEIMTTASACRTYNLLLSEGRRLVAGLIF